MKGILRKICYTRLSYSLQTKGSVNIFGAVPSTTRAVKTKLNNNRGKESRHSQSFA